MIEILPFHGDAKKSCGPAIFLLSSERLLLSSERHEGLFTLRSYPPGMCFIRRLSLSTRGTRPFLHYFVFRISQVSQTLIFLEQLSHYFLWLFQIWFCALHLYTPVTLTIIVENELSESLAQNFSLISKEDGDVDVGVGSEGVEHNSITYDVVGRVVRDRTYSAHTLQQNIDRVFRPCAVFDWRLLKINASY